MLGTLQTPFQCPQKIWAGSTAFALLPFSPWAYAHIRKKLTSLGTNRCLRELFQNCSQNPQLISYRCNVLLQTLSHPYPNLEVAAFNDEEEVHIAIYNLYTVYRHTHTHTNTSGFCCWIRKGLKHFIVEKIKLGNICDENT